jgi:hypothetical protein
MKDHELLARPLSTAGPAGVEPEAARADRGPDTLLGSQGSGN